MELTISLLISFTLLISLAVVLFFSYRSLGNLHLRALKLKKEAGHVSSIVSHEFLRRLSFRQKKEMVENLVSKSIETIEKVSNLTFGILNNLADSQKASNRAKRIKEAGERKKIEEKQKLEESKKTTENEGGSGI